MNTDIFIVSYKRDFRYLKFALKSIEKFATGFRGCVVMVPDGDFDECVTMARALNYPISVRSGEEWKDKGMLWHMYLEMTAPDYCPNADFIFHMDSDCVFTESVTPEDYFVNGKPVLMHASFGWLLTQQANLLNWKVAAENALGFQVNEETMRRHPAVHPVKTYKKAKECIEEHNRKSLADYMKEQRNSFPQSFAEYPTLGAVAWKHFHGDYHWINQEKEGFPHPKIWQAWSHREPTEADMSLFKEKGIA